MSAAVGSPKGALARFFQVGTLLLLSALFLIGNRVAPHTEGHLGTIASVGLLLVAGTLLSELFEPIGLPHLTGYLGAGVLAGPYVLGLVDHHAVDDLSSVNTLALALIALSGGAELRMELLRRTAKSLAWANLFQTVLVFTGVTITFLIARPLVSFVSGMAFTQVLGVALMWGVMAITRSPSACLGILSQTKAKGPVAEFSLAFIMASDIIVILVLAIVLAIAKPLIDPTLHLSMHQMEELGREVLGSVSVGTTIGLVLALYLRFVNRELTLVMIALGFGASELLRYLRFDTLLCFMTAGFVVQNLTGQGEKLLHAVERTSVPVFVIFFATAGAHLDLPLLRTLWPAALVFFFARATLTWTASRLSTNAANDVPTLKKWGWSSLVSQAGLALGIAVVIERQFPQFGVGFRSLAVASVAMNEVFGPILFKLALDRAGETSTAPEVERSLEEEVV
jgi:Kef-type K+ transport system membrane component KefB